LVTRLRLTDLRSYASADVRLGPGLNVVHGPNASGKTNLLEGLYLGCTGRSCRTSNEREVVRFGASAARVAVDLMGPDGRHSLSVGLAPGQPKRMQSDGAPVERLSDAPTRPLVAVFLPERLELVKGPPALRRSHVDTLIAALWPTRVQTRRSYSQALAQRNALLLRIRAGRASTSSLGAWETELARHGVALGADRAEVCSRLAEPFTSHAEQLGLGGRAVLEYRPRSRAATVEELAEELAGRRESDLARGFTGHGPHRDDLALAREGRDLRPFGSQGEHRLALLALLLAERDVLSDARSAVPLLLLDDVMSELDAARRSRLAAELSGSGQSVVTTTDLEHVPGGSARDVTRLAVRDGAVLQEAQAA
jgi:DNA replication and repair protein RecF